MQILKRFIQSQDGATAIEYALLAGLIAVAIIGGATALGVSLDGAFNSYSNNVDSTPSA